MSLIRIQGETERRNGICYQVDSDDQPIGVGGMGQVFKGICVNEKTGSTRPVAIKFLYDDLPPQAIERARREASIRLRNDNLVEMLGFIEISETIQNGAVVKHYHVVSELLTGVSLSDILEGKTKDRNGEEVAYAVKLLQDFRNDPEHFAKIVVVNVLSGLMALHDAGYIHRDIDPSNIMVTADGHIKLIDFGICKQMNNLTTNDRPLTVSGRFMGKPEYAAPELAIGDVKAQNQTTDIYAVGILLYQCIVGHTPFEGACHEILEKQLKEKLPLKVIKDKNLREIIGIACAKKQEQRYQTCAQMRVALETMNAGGMGMPAKKKKILLAAAVVVVVVIAGVLVAVNSRQDEAEQLARQAEFEQQKTQFEADINELKDEADKKLVLGLKKETDDYEQILMSAYTIYESIRQKLEQDSVYGVSYPDLEEKMTSVSLALDTIRLDLLDQADQLEVLGESEMAGSCRQRAESIGEFKKNR
ncbi:serine/threonine protein kinase [Bacteroides ilei]|uniref:serine/threonine protein kinase n=1 Tax=Bacteroides ilei TaxID=1907658 RepID=UPI00093069A9|nr:serine/threonine-protein kinase [Bacteroides ilei]